MPTRPCITVIGSGREEARLNALAEQVGAGLAAAGATLVCGGLGGVMAAACRGAVEAGGLTVGILPGGDAAESRPNPWVRVPIFTGMGQARNQLVVLSGVSAIAIGGGWGTLSEIALARKQGRPVTLLESWDLSKPEDPELRPATNADEAVRLAMEGAGH